MTKNINIFSIPFKKYPIKARAMLKSNSFKKLILFYLILFGSIAVFLNYFEILYNKTDSVACKFFLAKKGSLFAKGEFVAIKNHPTKYTTNIHFTKLIVGIPGDKISYHNNMLYINGKAINIVRPFTQDFRPLTPLKTKFIPQGFYLVVGTHSSSFDSRYSEFGLVRHENITGRAYPIF